MAFITASPLPAGLSCSRHSSVSATRRHTSRPHHVTAPSSCQTTPPSSSSPSSPSPSPSPSPLSRRQLLQGLVATTAMAVLATPDIAQAVSGSGLERAFSKVLFPKGGFNAPDSGSPPQVDQAVLSTPEGKAALQKLRTYEQNISELYAKFQAQPATTELSQTVRGMVSISDLRNALNVVNEAIDELAQVETDKVVRGIIQDIGELENAAALKPGGTRTQKKIVRTTDWFDQLEKDFKRLLAFYV